jgi:hypothetical protein
MKKIVSLGPNRHRYIRCTFCFEENVIKELYFERADGNDNVFHVCEKCLNKIKEEVNEIDFKR